METPKAAETASELHARYVEAVRPFRVDVAALGLKPIDPASIYSLCGDRILVEPIEAQRDSEGLVDSPGGLKLLTPVEQPQEGIVLLVGPGRYEHGQLIPMRLQPGMRVNYGRHAGQKVLLDGQTLLMLREPDIFGYWQ